MRNTTVPLLLAVALAACGADPAPGTGSDPDVATIDGEADVTTTVDAEADAAEADADAEPAPEPPPEYSYDGELGPEDLFQHGVASGDPLSDRVILWTRLTQGDDDDVDVFWDMATDPAFEHRTHAGWTVGTAGRDFTVKVDATGLQAGTTYYYRFHALGRTSPVGRTGTTAAAGTALDRVRLGVVSCSQRQAGYFPGYRYVAERADLDAVLHLGDYIYEYGASAYDLRPAVPSTETVTVEQYRQRYGAYRLDAELQEAHRQHPWIVVWDDHETANNSWMGGAQNHDAWEGSWSARKAAAWQAYEEWQPIRAIEPLRLWRAFRFGDLVELTMLDTRIWGREIQLDNFDPLLTSETRTLLGFDQEAWFEERMMVGGALWQVIGQQVMLSHLLVDGNAVNTDQWDGYPAARDRALEAMSLHDDVVVVTGDIHTSWANELTLEPGVEGYDVLGVELVVPGITSAGVEALSIFVDALIEQNPHVRWTELSQRGLLVLELTPTEAQADWFHYGSVASPDVPVAHAASFATLAGDPGLVERDGPLADVEAPDLAP